MRARLLPPEEWDRLRGTELEALYPLLSPDAAKIIVIEVEREESPDAFPEIVGTWAVYPQVHAEGIWIAPRFRSKGVVAKHLMEGLASVLSQFEASGFCTASMSDEVTSLIKGLGGEELPGKHFVVPAPHILGV